MNFRHVKLIFFVQIFFLARYGWLLSIPHVYTARFCLAEDGTKKLCQNPLNLELPGSFRERLHIDITDNILQSRDVRIANTVNFMRRQLQDTLAVRHRAVHI